MDRYEIEGIESRKADSAATTADRATSCDEEVHHLDRFNYRSDGAVTPEAAYPVAVFIALVRFVV
jgi:hypothetical protein